MLPSALRMPVILMVSLPVFDVCADGAVGPAKINSEQQRTGNIANQVDLRMFPITLILLSNGFQWMMAHTAQHVCDAVDQNLSERPW